MGHGRIGVTATLCSCWLRMLSQHTVHYSTKIQIADGEDIHSISWWRERWLTRLEAGSCDTFIKYVNTASYKANWFIIKIALTIRYVLPLRICHPHPLNIIVPNQKTVLISVTMALNNNFILPSTSKKSNTTLKLISVLLTYSKVVQ